MNVIRPNTIGIDLKIKRFQTDLYNKLKVLWRCNDFNLMVYGRANKNQNGDGIVPEIYDVNSEYKDLYWDDSLRALMFFAISSQKVERSMIMSDVYLVVMANVDAIKSTSTREDEDIKSDVEKICMYSNCGFNMIGIQTGVEAVFSEFSGYKKTDAMKLMDTHPYHCFRVNFNILHPVYNN